MQKIVYIGVEELHPHPDNPRKNLGDLTELAESIKAKGVLQNLTVVPGHWMTKEEWSEVSARYKEHPTEEDRQLMNRKWIDTGYTVIIGHRRHAAAKQAGLTELPCVVATMTPQEQFETMMVENVQRSDLTVYEQAEGFQMMLDMGSSVEEVAQKTGFSKTTVRNRVRLMELDKVKFKKAQERGGTMQDYIKLNMIQDPNERNKVLDAIGTSDFNHKLKCALDDQAYAKELAIAMKAIQEAEWCKERTDETTGWNGDYQHYKSFDKYNRRPIEQPKDTDVASYIYTADDRGFYIYRKGPKTEKKLSPEEQKKQSLERKLSKIHKELDQMSSHHREMRVDFVRSFDQLSSSEMDITAFAARAMVSGGYCSANVFTMGELLNIEVKTDKNYTKYLDKEPLNKALFYRPLYVLLCAAYSKLDSSTAKYHNQSYSNKHSLLVPGHAKNSDLDMLYEGLKTLGYEMCEEEIQMQSGTHPLFKDAKKLVSEYEKEKKE